MAEPIPPSSRLMIGVDPEGLLNPSHISVVFTVSHFGDFPFSNVIVSVAMVIADLFYCC